MNQNYEMVSSVNGRKLEDLRKLEDEQLQKEVMKRFNGIFNKIFEGVEFIIDHAEDKHQAKLSIEHFKKELLEYL